MEIKINKKDLQKALITVEGVIPAREIRSILSHTLIETGDNEIIVTASDLELIVSTSVVAEVKKPGRFTLPAKKLNQIINEYKGEELLLSEKENGHVEIYGTSESDQASFSLMGSPADSYPGVSFPNPTEFISLDLKLFLEMLEHTSYAMAKEDVRYIFNGLYMKCDKKEVIFVCTDGRRLALIPRAFPEALPIPKDVIVPQKAIKEFQRMAATEETGEIAYNDTERRLFFIMGKTKLATKLIDGNFPDYKQVIPNKVEHSLLLNKENLTGSIRQVAVMAAEPSRQIRLNFTKNCLKIHASTPDLGEAQDSMNIDYSGEDMTIAFNAKYIMDVLNNIGTEDVILAFSSPDSPAIFRKPNDEAFLALIMPMKV